MEVGVSRFGAVLWLSARYRHPSAAEEGGGGGVVRFFLRRR